MSYTMAAIAKPMRVRWKTNGGEAESEVYAIRTEKEEFGQEWTELLVSNERGCLLWVSAFCATVIPEPDVRDILKSLNEPIPLKHAEPLDPDSINTLYGNGEVLDRLGVVYAETPDEIGESVRNLTENSVKDINLHIEDHVCTITYRIPEGDEDH